MNDTGTKTAISTRVVATTAPPISRIAFEVAAPGSVAAGAVLEIREVPGKAWCMDCSELVAVAQRGDACPGCQGYTMIVEQGDEMRLKELEVF